MDKETTCMLTEDDYEQVVRLLGLVSDPSAGDVNECRKSLAKGLADLVGADLYLWLVGVFKTEQTGEAMPTTFVEGGWLSEAECTAFYRLSANSKAGFAIQRPVQEQSLRTGSVTGRIVDIVPADVWKEVGDEYYALGYIDCMLAMSRIGESGYSCLGLHRRQGRPLFSLRDRFLLHTVFHNIDWIHSPGLQHEAGSTALSLTFRQREVLLLLLRGKSRKSIAASLGLSEHTVVDYLRQIYRKFDVQNRHELLSQFASGGITNKVI